MEVVYPRCAGLDVHKKTVVACRVRPTAQGQPERETQTFGTTTREILRLGDWLAAWEVTHVVMESTGEYWRPVYNLLEGQFALLLANPQHVRQVPGRKTDVGMPSGWRSCCATGWWRAASCRPAQRDLRALTRTRMGLVQDRTRVANRLQRVLEDANLKLASVVSDIRGVSAQEMLRELVAGQEGAAELAQLARGALRHKIPQLEAALEGRLRQEHRFLVSEHLAHLDFLDERVEAFSAEIVAQMGRMGAPEPPNDPTSPGEPAAAGAGQEAPEGAAGEGPSEDPPAEARPVEGRDRQVVGERVVDTVTGEVVGYTRFLPPLSPLEAVELLQGIPGIGRLVAETVVAEVGTDMSRFPSADHLASWAGLAPGNNRSAGRNTSGKTRPGNRTLRTALIQAASAVTHIRAPNYLTAQYHHLVGRRGAKRAKMAVAHSMIVAIYHMLARHEPYRDLGGDYYDRRKKERLVRYYTKRLEDLGCEVTVQPTATPR